MAKMKSAVMLAPGRIVLEDVERPEVDDDHVIVQTAGIGVCGSNLHWWRGSGTATAYWPFPIRGGGGHEYGGVVVETGKNIRRVQPGDRVAIDLFHSASCGQCEYCAAGAFSHCAAAGQFVTPGFTEYLKLPEKGLHVLPDGIEPHLGSLIEPAATPVAALRRLGMRGGERVVVIGAGVLGLAAAGAAKALGAEKVVITAKYDHQAALAPRFGIDAVVRSGEDAVGERLLEEVGGGGADIVVETVGGNAPTLALAADVVRHRGTVIPLGLWDEPVPVDSWKSAFKEINYLFCLAYGQCGLKTDYRFTIDLMASGRLPLEALVTHELPLERIADAFDVAANKNSGSVKVVVRP
ncbi:zinc-dependent alcohol dehydrogenase [Aromatoleum toluclasticum]|uniref:zinc-dependent alcohol dehydrogenase n=1 Tax=Aromatoleum toluclasticum TaxID=92003 RepID=UPI00037694EE|nr:zinc-binding dehydrogenase [Aromatoleum toluclasticum]